MNDPEVAALAEWTRGIAALTQGRMEDALAHLDRAAAGLAALDKADLAAETQVPQLMALALLGRYDEAERCGLAARDAFLRADNAIAAAKVELNLGHMLMRRDDYTGAEAMYAAAAAHLDRADDRDLLISAAVARADALMWQRQFDAAAALYDAAIAQADAAGLRYLRAVAQLDLGILERLRGRYDKALQLLESSRRAHVELGMPFQAANAEQYLADVYLDLHMADEALTLYERALPAFAEEGMRHEQAWMLAHRGRALHLLGRVRDAGASLQAAHDLFREEANAPSVAMVEVLQAELAAATGDHAAAIALSGKAEDVLLRSDAPSWLLVARWLRGDALRAQGHAAAAARLLAQVLDDAQAQSAPQIALRCHVSLGQLHMDHGRAGRAEPHFLRAVALIEAQRGTLPAEEFRTAFLSAQLTPYARLARLALDRDDLAQAFRWTERARARALADHLRGASAPASQHDDVEGDLTAHIDRLRVELNWCYSQLNERSGLTAASREALLRLVREREAHLSEAQLQLSQHGGSAAPGEFAPFDLQRMQRELGSNAALVAYFSDGDELGAFVVTDRGIQAKARLARAADVAALVAQMRFQIDALRHGSASMRAHLPQLVRRSQHYLRQLHEAVLAPVQPLLGARRLVVIPHGALHYVPFCALFDGAAYACDTREVSVAPSAAVLQHCLSQPARPWARATLLGVPDSRAPGVRDEVTRLASAFPRGQALLDGEATLAALRAHAPSSDVVHLACHGVFRPDNPYFSALRLGDGWMTVRDAYDLRLNGGLVVLSACETGVSAVTPGDELIGVARGFISAGAASLVVSLWTADDAATSTLMQRFYAELLAGRRPAAALRAAQLELRRDQPHPFFWSAFTLIGRW